jgi:hypothetical protein
MVEARVTRLGRGIAVSLPVSWLVERYGEVPRELELACGGRRVRLRLAAVTSRSARYYALGAGRLAIMEADECVPAR